MSTRRCGSEPWELVSRCRSTCCICCASRRAHRRSPRCSSGPAVGPAAASDELRRSRLSGPIATRDDRGRCQARRRSRHRLQHRTDLGPSTQLGTAARRRARGWKPSWPTRPRLRSTSRSVSNSSTASTSWSFAYPRRPTLAAALLLRSADVSATFAPTHAVVFQAVDGHDAVQANESLPVLLIRFDSTTSNGAGLRCRTRFDRTG